jgi:putative restriction endonuclease
MKGWIAIVTLEDAVGTSYRPTAGYHFGDQTPHHRHVAANDIFFIRSQTQLLAVARVQRVEAGAAEKPVHRCPICGTGQLGFRSTRTNSYRCLYGHEFSQPAASVRDGTEYKASFGVDYLDVAARIEAAEMRPFELTNSRQLSLRPCDLEGLTKYILRRDRNAAATLKGWFAARPLVLNDDDADTADPADVLDEREHRHLGIRLRRGRKVFRDELIRRYGARCMVSGCTVTALLEAAYIQPDAVPKFNNPTNGLLLRADLHTLFDLNLMGIDPVRLSAAMHPSLMNSEYAAFHGAALLVGGGRGPNRRALATRWPLYKKLCARPDDQKDQFLAAHAPASDPAS